MNKTLKLMAVALLPTLAWGQSIRYEQNTLFLKLKNANSLPTHPLIQKTKHLFASIYQIETSDALTLENDLRHHPEVLWAEKSFISEPRELSRPDESKNTQGMKRDRLNNFNDPEAGRVWAFRDAAIHGVSVDRAYRQLPNRNAETVIVAVVDTGVDYNHEDLKNVMWTNLGEIAGNGIDDDGNGYVDDVYGINTLSKNAQGQATGNPMDTHSHGTHVSGTIAAEQNNGIGIAGIASSSKIMAIRTVPSNGDETDRDVVESFLYAAKHGARIINCSFGKKINEGGMIVSETIQHIGEAYGTLVIAAAGNDSFGPFRWHDLDRSPRYPASFQNDHLLVVASTQNKGSFSSFSNIGSVSVDLAAPGTDVYSTTPGNRYQNMSGTSMASPTTAGVAAQVLSYFPGLDALELKDVLMKSVTPVSSFSGRIVTGGRVDLMRALNYAEQMYPDQI